MSSDCPECIAAAAAPHWTFRGDCKGCAARAVARGPNFRDSRVKGAQTRRYRDELTQFGVTHDEVRAAHAVDAEAKEKAA